MEEEKQEKNINDKVYEKVESKIEELLNEGVKKDNVDYLYKLVDIHKDIKNEEYWKEKIDMYNEGNYGRYSARGVPGTGRYREGSYSRRGVPGSGRRRGRYRGEQAIDEMYMNYGEYNEANESYNEGNYGAEGGMKESAEGIMENIFEIVEELKDTGSPEVMQVIKKYSKKIMEM